MPEPNLKPQIDKPVDPYQLNLAATPFQADNDVRLMVQVSDIAGMQFALALSIPAARAMMHMLRQGIEKAETTIVKPQSMVTAR